MKDNAGEYLIHNGELKKAGEYASNARDGGDSVKIYEVIRVIDGVPLFMEEHYERMKESMRLLGLKLISDRRELVEQVKRLAGANSIDSFNIKVTVATFWNRQETLVYVIKHYYPPKEEIERGVPVSLFTRERENPNIKIINEDYKEAVSRKIREDQVFEVLLVNGRNEITEGSRSNAFFIKEGKVYTAPGEQVLKGITRRYIIDTCLKQGYEVLEEPIPLAFLDEMEGMFISGTSIKVLPVASIGSDIGFRRYASSAHPVITAIRDGFDRLLEEYVSSRK